MPVAVHEWLVAPLALALAGRYSARTAGAARAAVEMAVLVAYGFALEWIAIAVFASHRYGEDWRLAPGGVPLAVAVVWAALIAAARALAAGLGRRRPLSRAAAAAALGVTLDLLMEPVAVRLGLWQWTPPGPWLGVPLGNFVGWAVIVGGYVWGAERFAGEGSLAGEAARRLGLAAGSIAALVVVGTVWTRLGLESFFVGTVPWFAWALILGLTAVIGWPVEPGLLRGGEPHAVFGLLLGTFLMDAAVTGGSEIGAVAAGSALVLGGVLGRSALSRTASSSS